MSERARQTLFFIIVGLSLLAIVTFFAPRPVADWLFQKGLEAKREWRLETAINYFAWSAFCHPRHHRTEYASVVTAGFRQNRDGRRQFDDPGDFCART